MSLGQPWGEWQWFSEMWWAERGPSMRLPRLETGQLPRARLVWGLPGLQGHGVLPVPRVMSHESVNTCCRWSQVSLFGQPYSLTTSRPDPVSPETPASRRNSWSSAQESGRPLEPDIPLIPMELSDLPSFGSNIWFISWATQLELFSFPCFLPPQAAGSFYYPGIQSLSLSQRPPPLHTTVRSFPAGRDGAVSVATSLRSSSACSLNHKLCHLGELLSPVDRTLPTRAK